MNASEPEGGAAEGALRGFQRLRLWNKKELVSMFCDLCVEDYNLERQYTHKEGLMIPHSPPVSGEHGRHDVAHADSQVPASPAWAQEVLLSTGRTGPASDLEMCKPECKASLPRA